MRKLQTAWSGLVDYLFKGHCFKREASRPKNAEFPGCATDANEDTQNWSFVWVSS